MIKSDSQWNNKSLFTFWTLVFLFSLIYSKFLLSVSMISWFVLSFVDVDFSFSHFSLSFSSGFRRMVSSFLSQPRYWVISLVFFSIVFSGINSTHLDPWLHQIQLKLPFLILPFVFYIHGPFTDRWKRQMHYAFIAIITVTMVHMMVIYFLDFAVINEKLSKGQHFPTPIHHVSLSLMVAYATISSLILWRSDQYFLRLKKWMGLIFILLFLFLHILAVRSGIVVCYLSLLIYVIYEIIYFKKYLFGVIALCLCTLSPIIAYQAIPSFQRKIEYSMFDFKKLNEGNAVHYSDGGRILSYKMGLSIFKENLIMGTGIGDINNEADNWYHDNVPEYINKLNLPHNQILFLLAATGLIGCLLFLFALLYPFFSARLYREAFALILYTILFASFIVESTLEHSFTIAFFLFFILIQLSSNEQELKGPIN